jgi:hypothetical protein
VAVGGNQVTRKAVSCEVETFTSSDATICKSSRLEFEIMNEHGRRIWKYQANRNVQEATVVRLGLMRLIKREIVKAPKRKKEEQGCSREIGPKKQRQ